MFDVLNYYALTLVKNNSKYNLANKLAAVPSHGVFVEYYFFHISIDSGRVECSEFSETSKTSIRSYNQDIMNLLKCNYTDVFICLCQ